MAESNQANETYDEQEPIKSIGSMMGEIVWLMTQSPVHKHLSLADLEWALMPAIILGQYKIYREGKKPMAAALWGYLDEKAEERLKAAGRLAPQDWGNNAQLSEEDGLVRQDGGTLWLIELITPFHNDTNKHREQIVLDLTKTALKGQKFKMMHINPATGKREELNIGSEVVKK